MTYQEYKDYIISYLWKKGDQVLIDNLDNLIRQGEAMLTREVRDEYRHTSVYLPTPTDLTPLPADYRSMRQVTDTSNKLGEFTYVSPAEVYGSRDRYNNQWRPIYSLEGDALLLCGPTADPTRSLQIDYVRKIADYKTSDESWFNDREPDIFLYATLYQTAPFLREDERVQLWQGLYKDAVAVLNEESAHQRERGVYGAMPLPRNASGHTQRGSRRIGAYKLNTRP
jgi:hypothetical protein